jgi:putative tricarboxylic transport membrane protein
MANPSMSPAAPQEAPPAASAPNAVALALYRLVALGFAALGLWVCWYSYELLYYTPVGPGPGFFPMWLGGLLVVLSLGVFGSSLLGLSPPFPERIIPKRTPATEMAVTFAAIAFFALFVERAGFVPVIFVMLLILMLVNRVPLVTALLIALAGSLGVAYVFVHWLGVFLPVVPYGLLGGIGL